MAAPYAVCARIDGCALSSPAEAATPSQGLAMKAGTGQRLVWALLQVGLYGCQ